MSFLCINIRRNGWLILVVLVLIAVSIGIAMQEHRQAVATLCDLGTDDKRVHYLGTLGWEADNTPIEVVDIQIPTTFDEVYLGYNELQKKAGFDLTPYRGKVIKRYTYRVKNYPDLQPGQEVRANLFMYGQCLVAGDIMSPRIDGFMLPLKKKI